MRIGTVETIGSNCFHKSISLNRHESSNTVSDLPDSVSCIRDESHNVRLAHFSKFSSLASGSLGASTPAAAVVKMALNWPGGLKAASVPDELSIEALLAFAGE